MPEYYMILKGRNQFETIIFDEFSDLILEDKKFCWQKTRGDLEYVECTY